MLAYIIRRLLLIIPTLFGIMVLNFIIVQAAPGGPIEQIVAKLHGTDVSATARFGGSANGGEVAAPGGGHVMQASDAGASRYPGAQGVDPELIKELEHQFGFDQPLCHTLWQDDLECTRGLISENPISAMILSSVSWSARCRCRFPWDYG